MAEHAEYLKTRFTVAADLDEEQKRHMEITRLRDDAERVRLEKLREQRDEALAALNARQEQERERIIEQEVRKRLQGTSDLRYEMRGGGSVPPREREQRLRRAIDEQFREKHDRNLEETRSQWNERIDGILARAQVREQELQENSRDITSPAPPHADSGRTDEDRQRRLDQEWERIQQRRAERRERGDRQR
jgi:hypothetical protein